MTTRSMVRTERSTVTLSDFAAELQALESNDETTNILIHGDSNAGKTVLAGTAPGKVLWLVGEPGFKSASRRGATGYRRRIPDTATALAAVEYLRYKERYRKLDWIIIDGISTMEKRFRLGYAQEAFDNSPETKRSRAHRNLPDKPDYFNTQNFLLSWLPYFIDMEVNLLITAHSYRTDKTENGELLIFPGFQGKVNEVSNAISGLMDITGYYEARHIKTREGARKLVRRLYFEPPDREDVRIVCGDKFGTLGKYMDFPTLPRILAKVNGETNESA